MAGPGLNEARITVEAGASRFVARTHIGKGPISADTLLEALPRLTESMSDQLERVRARETKK